MPMRTRAGKIVLIGLMLLAGCPTRFDPRAETVRSSPNSEADHAYREARARLDIGDFKEAQARFAVFLEKYPNDPLAPSARLGATRAALGLGEGKKAKELIEPLAGSAASPGEDPSADPTRARARYLLGMALHKTGDWQRSRELLRPFASTIASGDDAVELHAVLADDAAHVGELEEAFREYNLFFAGARPPEKLYIRDRVSQLVETLPPGEALRLWNVLPKDGIAAAFIGRKVATERRAAGDESTAKAILDESRSAREKAGLEEGRAAPTREAVRAVGCVLPLTGKSRALGERALRGALLAADLMSGALPSGVPIEIRVRDSGSDPARAQAAVEELANENVVVLLGSPDRIEAQMAAPKAESLGVPFLGLAPDDSRRGPLTFKMVRPRSATAVGLVAHAKRAGARSIAVLAAESAYGRSMSDAIKEAAKLAGVRVAADIRYPENATTFIDPVRKLQSAAPDAVIVPAPARDLSLIAPQLSASGVTRMPGVKPTGKVANLYATADGLNAQFLQSTAKYLEGAILAPTFYPNVAQPQVAAFMDKYRAAYNEEPTGLDVNAFDAVRAARIALEHADGTVSRAAIANQLTQLAENGLSGDLGFTAAGERAGTTPLYVVEAGGLRAVK
jgi:branched-chain amino acid transport system substrate-binding protein